MSSSRLTALCGVLAPAAFIGGWAICGALRAGYDPVQEAISQLAREGTPNRPVMTACFLGFGLLLPVFAQRLPALVGAGTALRATATVAGASALAVAAFPLQREGGTGDLLHEISAGIGYVAMAASPALGARGLSAGGHRKAAAVAVTVSAVSVVSLAVSVSVGPTGLWQRVGLGVVDLWFAGWGLRALRR